MDSSQFSTEIKIKPIGLIRTPYIQPKDIPIQGVFKQETVGEVTLFPPYPEGLKDIAGFSYLYLLFYFHLSPKETLVGKPYLETEDHGIFSIRSPHRPNHIGLSVVELLEVGDDGFKFKGVDMLDNTPLLDIKPYVTYFDNRSEGKNGWLDKHFRDGDIPDSTILK
ncbi:MAG: hypothetical protein APR63_06285 [Desulfuromonas sp. SDB]|nr:MAG: hypothetical protein APR63_06285 [Desulfuromonas sp. SDB]